MEVLLLVSQGNWSVHNHKQKWTPWSRRRSIINTMPGFFRLVYPGCDSVHILGSGNRRRPRGGHVRKCLYIEMPVKAHWRPNEVLMKSLYHVYEVTAYSRSRFIMYFHSKYMTPYCTPLILFYLHEFFPHRYLISLTDLHSLA